MDSVVYPGTFDPITLGHEDFVRRASKLYEKVVVAVAADTGTKKTMFSFDERVELAQRSLQDIQNIEVAGYAGLTIDFAVQNNEFQLASMNRVLTREVETAFLTPTDKYTFISSTLVREVAQLGGDVTEFVSPLVKDALLRKVGRA